MALETKTQDELEAIIRGAVRGHITDADVSEGSDYDITARMAATAARLGQAQAAGLAKEIFPADASDEFLERHARRKGLTAQPAAKAVGKIQILSSTFTPQPIGSELEHDDGTAYVTTANATPTNPAVVGKTVALGSTPGRLIISPNTTGMAADQVYEVEGHIRAIREVIGGSTDAVDLYEPLPRAPTSGAALTSQYAAVVAIEAIEVGAAGNKPVGDVLTLSAPQTGITPEVRVLELSGGGDAERPDELRARVVDADAEHPGGGNREHIRTLARETPGVRIADAIVFPGLRGLGTCDVIPIGPAGARRVGAVVCAAIAAHLADQLDERLDLDVYPLEYDTPTDVDITVTTGVGYEADWSGGPLAIAVSPDSTTGRVYLTATAVGVVPIFARVLIPIFTAGRWRTYECEVTDVATIGAEHWLDVRVLDGGSALPAAPVDTDPGVFPGGPLAASVIEAVEAYFDTLGPSRKVASAALSYERHPEPAIAWDDTVRLGALSGEIDDVPGAVDVDVNAPVANVQPNAPQTARLGKLLLRFEEI